MKRHYIVGYDISDPKRLTNTAKVVKGFGSRIQYSFFHCFLSENQKKKLKMLLTKVINDKEDQVMIMPVTEAQLKDIDFLGFKTDLKQEGIIIV